MARSIDLIVTLPSFANYYDIKEMFASPNIDALRFITDRFEKESPKVIVEKLNELSKKYKKQVFIELETRKLKITNYVDPLYEPITLNHNIVVSKPARIIFADSSESNIMDVVDGNKLRISPIPKGVIASGQYVSIISKNVSVTDDFLTEKDKLYIEAMKDNNMKHIIAPYVEDFSDLEEIYSLYPGCKVVSRIDNFKGLEFVEEYARQKNHKSFPMYMRFMINRETFYNDLGREFKAVCIMNRVIDVDERAICSSKIFDSLARGNFDSPDFGDFEDLLFMHTIGFNVFVLDEKISLQYFTPAINAWKKFKEDIHGE